MGVCRDGDNGGSSVSTNQVSKRRWQQHHPSCVTVIAEGQSVKIVSGNIVYLSHCFCAAFFILWLSAERMRQPSHSAGLCLFVSVGCVLTCQHEALGGARKKLWMMVKKNASRRLQQITCKSLSICFCVSNCKLEEILERQSEKQYMRLPFIWVV